MQRIDSVMDHYLEKLPAHPDLGIIGGGGAVIKDFAGGHGLLIVSEPVDGERDRVLALRQERKIGRRPMAKDFVVYRVHIHKAKQEELYELLEGMPKSIRGLYIREALEHYRLTKGLSIEKPQGRDVSLQGAYDQDFGGRG